MKIAYLANCFPESIERYVMEEISGLRATGIQVLPTSARRPARVPPDLAHWRNESLYLQSFRWTALLRSILTSCLSFRRLWPCFRSAIASNETLLRRAKALLHTCLGVYYAVLLRDQRVDHIHVHHGYYSAWIAMVAARLLGITYSMTLHGSDLLLNAAYLDVKLDNCAVCFTISQYNREYILTQYPHVPRERVLLRRLGVDLPADSSIVDNARFEQRLFALCVGRLHPVKNHVFLIDACAVLKQRGVDYLCFIAGDGPERDKLENRIRLLGLEREVKMLGHVAHEDLEAIYPLVDLVVLTSKSEGIPLALMEAMAHGKPVLAPEITGIPELVRNGKTGFLYRPGSIPDFVARIELVQSSLCALGALRRAARDHVSAQFNRAANLQHFVETFSNTVSRIGHHADPVLQ